MKSYEIFESKREPLSKEGNEKTLNRWQLMKEDTGDVDI
jgi:hypothetical protein